MEPLMTGLFIFGLYKATEKIWEKGFDAAWEPVGEALKQRFTRWAGRDKESQRRAAFVRAADVARANALRYAADPRQAERILDALNGERDRKGAEALAEEGAKLMLFSAIPDVPRLTTLCQERLRWDALWAGETPPPPETVAAVLSDFLTNLREALLDQEPYHDLIQRETLRTLRQIVTELRPVAYDDEATYRYQMAEMYRQLEFVGIPELKERRPITVGDIFIRLRVEWETEVPSVLEKIPASRIRKEAADKESGASVPQPVYEMSIEGLDLSEQTYSALKQTGITQVGEILGSFSPEELSVIRNFGQRSLTELRKILTGPIDVDKALRGTKQLVVLGDPGAGKTTLLKYLTVICAEGRAEDELGLEAEDGGSPLPVFIPLREFAAECAERDQDYCLLDYLYTHAREHLMLNLPQGFFEEALEAGRCLVCLDGLDEVWAVGQRKAVSDAVKALTARFRRNRYVVTSRIVGYGEAPLDRRDFTHHTILPLEDDDIREFVRKWYAVRERDPVRRKRKADDLIATIKREPRIKALATNPLLLTIIALVHRIEAELPHERVKLYNKCVTALVDTWEEVKGLTIAGKQRPFYRYRRRLLERLAYELHTRAEEPGQLQTVKEGDLELLLTRFLMENRRLGLTGDPDGTRDEAQAFIRLARGRTGLLVERGERVFGFPHLTFQEYLAACDIENRCMPYGVDAIWKEIKDRLHDPNWREIILLLLGSLNRYEDAPTLVVERILEAGEGDKFEPVLHRHLYLAARALADRVDVANDLHRAIVGQLLTIAHEGFGVFVSHSTGEARIEGESGDALTALGDMEGDPHAAEGLLALVCDPQVGADVRGDAASALGRLGRAEGKVLNGLLALARDLQVEPGARIDAVEALGQLGCAEEEVVGGLLALAHDIQVESWVRRRVASTLGQLGRAEEARDILLSLARDPQVWDLVRCEAAEALGQLGCAEEAAEVLLSLARDPQVKADVRSDIAPTLGQLGRAEEARDILLSLARDPQVKAWVRSDAALTLGQLGHAEEARDILLSLARDPQVEADVRRVAASGLGRLERTGEKVMDSLLALARDLQVVPVVRSAAASALGRLGWAEKKVLDGLLALSHDGKEDAGVRRAAAEALGQLGRAEAAAEVLLALARDETVHTGLRCQAAEALGQLGRAEEAAEVLLALARDPQVEAWVRSDAASTLGQLGRIDDEVLDGLLALVRDPHVEAYERLFPYESLKRLVGSAVESLKP